VLYKIPVEFIPANASTAVADHVIPVVLRLAFPVKVSVGAVESIVKVVVVRCLFCHILSVAIALSVTLPVFRIGVVRVHVCSLFVFVHHAIALYVIPFVE
jgi:hypothetical protein